MTCDNRNCGTVCLADDGVLLRRVADPVHQVAYCPGLERLASGRLVGTLLTHDTREKSGSGRDWVVGVYTSDDAGASWEHRKDLPMVDGQPFTAGDAVYVIGGREDLMISRSDDQGSTWSDLVPLGTGRLWYSFPGMPVRANGRIYIEKECRAEPVLHGFPVWILAPVVMSAPLDADLTRPAAWTFSNVLSFADVLARHGGPHLCGVPFYAPGVLLEQPVRRAMGKIGWGEGNLVQIHDPSHVWHDPTGRTFHIFLRAESGTAGFGCLAKAVESDDGRITVDLERAPSGAPTLFIPLPGGQGAFNIFYDDVSRLHWLISSASIDSMRRVETLDPWHYGMPYNERKRIALYFSRNCMDWCFAGLVADAVGTKRSHFHCSTVIDGEDLIMLMRTADAAAVNEHNSNTITFHRIREFRKLAY
ncbi:MAG: hypothetical protein A3K19_13610 [Lentisphaerae bacterium RIFOXYB12_FULL_65_16]|nr:MAG: hypothetical protein A3K18_05410 [Lentisphaerae bacterium RIFOXYA12_64_32]OGV93073.1 MAG: hypothetical protein A3K19_13610 [Lentisphaerae bacterium RIFOXYB12_FULL_65_16]